MTREGRGRGARRAITVVAAIVALQGTLLALYFSFDEPEPAEHALDLVPAERPALVWETADGVRQRLSDLRGRPVLLHVWATWCPPCREELPALLEWSDETDIQVVALTVDTDWSEVRRFLGGDVPSTIVRADGEAVTRALGTQELPETWILDREGTTRARLRGAADWTSTELREAVVQASE